MTLRRRSGEPIPTWAGYSDDRLLRLRFCDLGISTPGPFVESCIEQLFGELDTRGLRFRPRIWLSDEWFSPDGIAGIAMPFYLVHSRLTRLERRVLHAAEGAPRTECLKLLRHETAHALHHAYRLQRRSRWQALFGRSSTRYPARYRPDPGSRDYVHHLRDWYAQCHPDEDFAETFAVWLQSGSRWRRRYADWPALAKLEYVDELMSEVSSLPQPRASRRVIDPLHRLTTTLGEHYRLRLKRFGRHRRTTLDDPLRRVVGRARGGGGGRARRGTAILRRLRPEVRSAFGPAAAETYYAFDMVYDDLIDRSLTLDLRTTRSEATIIRDLRRFTRRHVRALLHDPSSREWVPV